MITIETSEFRTRSDLDQYVKSLEGQEGIITGVESDMKRLQLSKTTTVHGFKCEVLPDKKGKKLGFQKPPRGVKLKKKRIIKSKK